MLQSSKDRGDFSTIIDVSLSLPSHKLYAGATKQAHVKITLMKTDPFSLLYRHLLSFELWARQVVKTTLALCGAIPPTPQTNHLVGV